MIIRSKFDENNDDSQANMGVDEIDVEAAPYRLFNDSVKKWSLNAIREVSEKPEQ